MYPFFLQIHFRPAFLMLESCRVLFKLIIRQKARINFIKHPTENIAMEFLEN